MDKEKDNNNGAAAANNTTFRQRLARHFGKTEPEMEADGLAEQLANRWADELEQKLADYNDADGRITHLLEAQPQVAALLEAMLAEQDLPLRVAVKRTLAQGELEPQPGDDDYEAYAKKMADADAAAQRLDDNLQQSLALLKQFAQDKQLTEAEQQALVEAINADFDNLLERRLTADMLAGYRKRLCYEADVEAARNAGELKGRNDNIVARMQADRAAHLGDGLPPADRGGYAPRMLKGQNPVFDFNKIINR